VGRYARFKNDFWIDRDVRQLPSLSKLVYAWAFTNHRCGISGMYLLDQETARIECSMNVRLWGRAWGDLLDYEKANGTNLVHFDAGTGVVWVVGKFKQETQTRPGVQPSQKTIAAAVREVHGLPPSPLHEAFRCKYSHLLKGHTWGIDGGAISGNQYPVSQTHPESSSTLLGKAKKTPSRRGSKASLSSRGGGTQNQTGVDDSPAAKALAQAMQKELLRETTGDLRIMCLEMVAIGVKPSGGKAVFQHMSAPIVRDMLRRHDADRARGIEVIECLP
jgi:hypothetical protein